MGSSPEASRHAISGEPHPEQAQAEKSTRDSPEASQRDTPSALRPTQNTAKDKTGHVTHQNLSEGHAISAEPHPEQAKAEKSARDSPEARRAFQLGALLFLFISQIFSLPLLLLLIFLTALPQP